jgi:hypothetical protein
LADSFSFAPSQCAATRIEPKPGRIQPVDRPWLEALACGYRRTTRALHARRVAPLL